MQEYRYLTVKPNDRGLIWRTMRAESRTALEREMLASQVPVIQVRRVDEKSPKSRKRVGLNDLCNYTEQMETGFALGMPLLRMLDSCIECTASPALKTVLVATKGKIERGSGIATALANWPRIFDSIYVSFVAAGEKGSGRMDESFAQIKAMLVRNQTIRTKVRSVMMMPAMTLIVLILVLAFMMTVVVPKFQVLFTGTGVPLPLPTQILVFLSESLRGHPLLSALSGLSAITALIRFSDVFTKFPAMHAVALKMPVFGKLQRKVMLANFSRTLGQLINSGVPFVQALYLVRDLSNNVVYRLAIARAIISVSNGEKIAIALLPVKTIFGPGIIHQMSFGEEAGSIPSLLKTLTERQDRELVAFVEDIKPVLETLLVVIMAGLVGAVVVALYMPIFNIGQTLVGKH